MQKPPKAMLFEGFLLVVQANQISNQELEELKKPAIIKRQIDKGINYWIQNY